MLFIDFGSFYDEKSLVTQSAAQSIMSASRPHSKGSDLSYLRAGLDLEVLVCEMIAIKLEAAVSLTKA